MAGFSKGRSSPLVEEHHCLMVTTNLAFKEWTEIFGSERLTGATS